MLITINVFTTYTICSNLIYDRLTPPVVLASIPTRQDFVLLFLYNIPW